MRKKILIAVAVLMVIGVGAGFYILRYVAPLAFLQPRRIEFTEHRPVPEDYGLDARKFDVLVADSILLKGWFVFSKIKPAKATVVLLHGIGSCKEHMLGLSEHFANGGYNSVLYDTRAMGQSGGQYVTYGYYEKHDVSEYIDAALERFGDVGPFAVFGNSFGGAVALQAMAADDRIGCGIVESTFATLDETAFDYAHRRARIPFRWIVRQVLKGGERIAGFKVEDVRPEESAREVQQPVLLIHGEIDERISVDYARRVYANLASADKELYIVKGGNHLNLWQAGGAEYGQKQIEFLDDWIAAMEIPI